VPTEDENKAERLREEAAKRAEKEREEAAQQTEKEREEAAQKAEKEREANEKKSADLTVELAAATDRIRETAKWLVGTFGAIAAALLVGLQLSDIGELEGSDRTWAVIAAGAALLAVVAMIGFAASVLARARIPLTELSSTGGPKFKQLLAALNRNRSLYPGYESVEKLVDAVLASLDKQIGDRTRVENDALPRKQREEAAAGFRNERRRSRELNRMSDRLMASARAEDMRLTFASARNKIIGLAVVVVVAGVLFAAVDNAPDNDEETAALPQRPTAARLHLDASGQEKLVTILGPACNLKRVPVEVLSTSDEDVSDVVTIPAEGCAAARLSVDPEDGEFSPLESAPLPKEEETQAEEKAEKAAEEEVLLPAPTEPGAG